MKSTTTAWAVRAEANLATARREVEVKEDPNYEGVCYHARECVLDYLRARLEEAEVTFPGTSHLVVLLELCLELEPEWERFREHLRFLTVSAHASQEPGARANRKTALQAVEMAMGFRDEVRKDLLEGALADTGGE